MKVLVQQIDRYGESPIKFAVVDVEGVDNFGKGKADYSIIEHCLIVSGLFEIDDDFDGIQSCFATNTFVMDAQSTSVIISGEEQDYTFTRIPQ